MRLRNIPNASYKIAENKFCIQYPDSFYGLWHSVFKNANPIHIEIGTGKGNFIIQLAQQNPDINYIGIEKYTSVLLRAVQKMEFIDLPPANLRFICMNAENLLDVFSEKEISRIYLNFCDPWPKKRHARRRLTSRKFLNIYDHILTKDGTIEFKTDNKLLFDFSLEELPAAHWNIDACTNDLHKNSEMNKDNIMTEYEQKFSSLGKPIYKLIASR